MAMLCCGEHPVDLEALWARLERDPAFFDVRIARDGGFSEIPQLFTKMRWVNSTVSVAFIAMNIWAILNFSIPVLVNDTMFVDVNDSNTPDHPNTTPTPDFLILCRCNTFISELFGSTSIIRPAKVMAIAELFLLTLLAGKLGINCVKGYINKKPHQRWYAVSTIFSEDLNRIMTLSALKALNYVAPSVLVPKLMSFLLPEVRCKELSWCLVKRIFCAIVGYDAFLLKLWEVASSMVKEKETGNHLKILLIGLAFLNQMLGIVQVSLHVRSRVFEFIFGGEDGVVSSTELAIWKTWEAMLAQRIFEDLPLHHAIPVLFTFSDADFQRLALNEAQTGIKARMSEWSLALAVARDPKDPDPEDPEQPDRE